MSTHTETGRNGLVPAVHQAGADTERGLIEATTGFLWTNIPADEAHCHLMVKLAGNADKRAAALIGQTVAVKYAAYHTVESTDAKTGEVQERGRILLFTPDGETIATSGRAVHQAIAMIVRAVGPGPWDPPLMLKFAQQRGGNGHDYHTVSLVPRAAAAPAGGRR